jgi:biopolymer transport protein ExbD
MAGTAGERDGELISAINVTPFVDIVLVLLIVLMVTSTQAVRASLQVKLPRAASGGEAVASTLNVAVLSDGALRLDGAPVTEAGLRQRVRDEKGRNREVQAVIAGDRAVSYDRIIAVIDLVKQGGVDSFALSLERAAGGREP